MRAFLIGLGALLALAATAAATLPGASPVGRWVTEGGWSHIQIYECGRDLCGKIVWLKVPLAKDGQPKLDKNNPDRAKRTQPMVGLTMMWNFVKSADAGEWDGGRIYNPEDGETYAATMKLRPDGKLEVRGYVFLPLFGGSQRWERVR